MIVTLLSAFFAAAALLAITAIADSWRRHGAAMLALRTQLRACQPSHDLRYTLVLTQVRQAGPRMAPARFKAADCGLPLRQPEQRAA